MRITALAGGIGGARFLRGLRHHLQQAADDSVPRETLGTGVSEITVIGNTGDDIWIHGLRVCPDLDTVMYTLGEGIDPERGWGRMHETFRAKASGYSCRACRAAGPRCRSYAACLWVLSQLAFRSAMATKFATHLERVGRSPPCMQ